MSLEDDAGRFEGEGFHYRVRDGRFRLLRDVRAVQAP